MFRGGPRRPRGGGGRRTSLFINTYFISGLLMNHTFVYQPRNDSRVFFQAADLYVEAIFGVQIKRGHPRLPSKGPTPFSAGGAARPLSPNAFKILLFILLTGGGAFDAIQSFPFFLPSFSCGRIDDAAFFSMRLRLGFLGMVSFIVVFLLERSSFSARVFLF